MLERKKVKKNEKSANKPIESLINNTVKTIRKSVNNIISDQNEREEFCKGIERELMSWIVEAQGAQDHIDYFNDSSILEKKVQSFLIEWLCRKNSIE